MMKQHGRLLRCICIIAIGLVLVVCPRSFVPPLRSGFSTTLGRHQGQLTARNIVSAAPESSTILPTGLVVGSATLLLTFGLSAQRRICTKLHDRGLVRVACKAGGSKSPLVVIAGPPAAGKGTQCERIKDKFGYVHISTGDILRANVKDGTDLGKKASEYMTAGKLVPSELIVDLVKDRLAQPDVAEKGCLLDGFPRAPDQAKAMVDANITVDKFILIEVPDDTLVERGCGRRLDPETGDIYHMKFKPPPAEIVDRLVHRSDDQEEAIRERLAIYHDQVNGILPFFSHTVRKIDGLPKPEDVTSSVFAALEAPEAQDFESQVVDEEAMLAASSFAINPAELVQRCKDVLARGAGTTKQGEADLADDFEFCAPVVGPIGKDAYLEALGTFKIQDAFPDVNNNYHFFRVDPFEPDRVWFQTRKTATNTGEFLNKPSTGKALTFPPEAYSIRFNPDGKVKEFTVGYPMDRRIGNTGGLGGAFGFFYGVGRPIPIPECRPYKPSWQFRMLRFVSKLSKRFQGAKVQKASQK